MGRRWGTLGKTFLLEKRKVFPRPLSKENHSGKGYIVLLMFSSFGRPAVVAGRSAFWQNDFVAPVGFKVPFVG